MAEQAAAGERRRQREQKACHDEAPADGLEPREAEELPIPLDAAAAIDEKKLDGILRKSGVEAALDYSDPILLGDGLGMSDSEVKAVRDCWVQLRDRRKNRKHAPKASAQAEAVTL